MITRAQPAMPALDQHRVRHRIHAHKACLPPHDVHIRRLYLDFVDWINGSSILSDGWITMADAYSTTFPNILLVVHI